MVQSKIIPFLLVAVGTLCCGPTFAHAQSPLSQLAFDNAEPTEPSVVEPDAETIQQLIADVPVDVATNTAPANPVHPQPRITKSADSKGEARAALKKPESVLALPSTSRSREGLAVVNEQKMDWEKRQDASAFLVPRLRGPFVDQNSKVAITTTNSWKKNLGSCSDISDIQQLCNKSRALKELVNRFSGNDDFFDSQCAQKCSELGYAPVLSGFAVGSVPNGQYRMIDEGEECRYQIQLRDETASWQVLKGERGTCSCLPKTCL